MIIICLLYVIILYYIICAFIFVTQHFVGVFRPTVFSWFSPLGLFPTLPRFFYSQSEAINMSSNIEKISA